MNRRYCSEQIISRVADRVQLDIPRLPTSLKMSGLRDLAGTEHPTRKQRSFTSAILHLNNQGTQR